MTLGENRVRVAFNPSASGVVDAIKQRSAELINLVNELEVEGVTDVSEFSRCKSLAMTAYEEAAMWAVKATTIGK